MDPVRNPFAPGAGQRPPELAGRDRELHAFDVVLERVARGRPERSLVLTGLRGVGKTVLLGELRSMAVRAGWGAGKIELLEIPSPDETNDNISAYWIPDQPVTDVGYTIRWQKNFSTNYQHFM